MTSPPNGKSAVLWSMTVGSLTAIVAGSIALGMYMGRVQHLEERTEAHGKWGAHPVAAEKLVRLESNVEQLQRTVTDLSELQRRNSQLITDLVIELRRSRPRNDP